jgi:hypothetical protein
VVPYLDSVHLISCLMKKRILLRCPDVNKIAHVSLRAFWFISSSRGEPSSTLVLPVPTGERRRAELPRARCGKMSTVAISSLYSPVTFSCLLLLACHLYSNILCVSSVPGPGIGQHCPRGIQHLVVYTAKISGPARTFPMHTHSKIGSLFPIFPSEPKIALVLLSS